MINRVLCRFVSVVTSHCFRSIEPSDDDCYDCVLLFDLWCDEVYYKKKTMNNAATCRPPRQRCTGQIKREIQKHTNRKHIVYK